MKKILIIFWLLILILLCGCSKEEPIATISQATQKEITTLQKDIEKSTCENKGSLIERLDNIKAEINNITLACKTEKEVLKQENNKLKIIIISLFLFIVLGITLIVKHKVL